MKQPDLYYFEDLKMTLQVKIRREYLTAARIVHTKFD